MIAEGKQAGTEETGEGKSTRGSNVMLQQIPQPFVMATFISTMLIPPQSLYQAQGRQGEVEERRKMDEKRKRLERLSNVWRWGTYRDTGMLKRVRQSK